MTTLWQRNEIQPGQPPTDDQEEHVQRSRLGIVVLMAAVVALSGCSSGGKSTTNQSSQAPVASAERLNLKDVCPAKIIIQTDWNPESEYGTYYSMLGDNLTIDKKKLRVSGPLIAEGQNTGVQLEVRAGGPAIGFEPVTAQMFTDPSITLGQINTDEGIRFSAKQPTLGVVAPMEISPYMIMWDKERYPQFNTIIDIGQSKTKVAYFQGDTYMDYLIGSGILRKSQVLGNYDGTPGNWVASNGTIAQAGFATSEPYIYEHEVPQWNKPVKYALIHDTGYPMYPEALSIRSADKDKLAPCLKKLVPIVQRAQVDYMKSPDKTTPLVLRLVDEYHNGWQYSPGLAKYALDKMRSDFVNNGPDKTLGNFDMSRVQRLINIDTPIFVSQKKPPKANLKPEDIVTNEFINPAIGLTQ
jgi:hypothetical protein